VRILAAGNDQIARFAGEHQRPNKPAIYAVFKQLEELARAYDKGLKHI
jgi:hypothetical protein